MSHRRYLTRLIALSAFCSILFSQKRILTGIITSLEREKWLYRINRDSDFTNNTSPNIRMSFELRDRKILKNIFTQHDPDRLCPVGEENRTGELPPSLIRVDGEQDFHGFVRSGRVLDFTVTISTNLKLLFIGDSIMVQLAQVFDELLGGRESENRKVLWESWSGHEGGTVVAPTRGGGVSANWRMTGLLSKSNYGRPPANRVGGGWSNFEINSFLNHSYHPRSKVESQPQNSAIIGNFDVVLFRVMHGWMQLNEITHERLVEAVELSNELLGAITVVLITIPFTNNVITEEDLAMVSEINEDIREISRTWHLRNNSDTGVQNVLVIEYGMYCDQIIWSNARHLNYSVSTPLGAPFNLFDLEGPSFLLDRLDVPGGLYGKFPPSVPSEYSITTKSDSFLALNNFLTVCFLHSGVWQYTK